MEMTFEITEDTLTSGIQRALEAAVDFTPAMKSIAALMESGTRDRFDNAKSPKGESWAETLRSQKAGGRILVDSGALLQSISSAFDDNSAIAGTNLYYAALHQNGFSGKATVKSHERTIKKAFGKRLKTPVKSTVSAHSRTMNIVARPFLGFSKDEGEEIVQILSEHIRKAFSGS